ncbi:ASST-domain-containing protein [Dactylonectria macrodidyma]|uniref:ASST-domain-containing protein n=1 Tax=Dactylonectria macrodidyma TaxID=307937 RepID=A0A9P9F304_9HYPO|nr:ASST-domain-containing protein [Dactylonectria macrodidyma]
MTTRPSVCVLTFLLCLFFSSAVADVPLHRDWEAYQGGSLGSHPKQNFHSAPHVWAPVWQVNKLDLDRVDKAPYIFLAGGYNESQFGPSIISSQDLSLVWADEKYARSTQTRPFVFKGQHVLASYAGEGIRIYNQYYQLLYNIQSHLANHTPDGHEMYLTEDETFIVNAWHGDSADLRAFGGLEDGIVINAHFQEIDPVTDTTPEGDYLVSIKHIWCILLIDGRTSQVKWIMGGKHNQFKDISTNNTATFRWQHNPRLHGTNRMTLLDNSQHHNGFCSQGAPGVHCTRGLEIEFDPVAMTRRVVNEWYHPQGIITATRGSVQPLQDSGNTLIAWGQNALLTEYAPDGEVVMDVQRNRVEDGPIWPQPSYIYRAWKGDWEGKPLWGPNISANADPISGKKTIYVSWNGATEVKKWVLLLSDSQSNLTGADNVASESPRMGFETGFKLPRPATFARIAAVDKNDAVIGSTPAVHIASGTLYPLDYQVLNIKRPQDAAKGPEYHVTTVSPSVLGNFNDISSLPLYLASATSVGFAA